MVSCLIITLVLAATEKSCMHIYMIHSIRQVPPFELFNFFHGWSGISLQASSQGK